MQTVRPATSPSTRLQSVPPQQELLVVGHPVARPDAPEKVQGTARFVDDVNFAGQLYARVLRSPHAHARILRIDVGKAKRVPGVHAVLTARDIPGANLIPMIQQDWPLLADGETRHVGEGIALVAAETREAAEEAAAAIRVVYEPLPPLLDMDEAFDREEIIKEWKILRGDVDAAFADPDNRIFEATYQTPYQEHAYLETNGMIALPDGLGGIVIYGSLQCPFYVQKAVASVLGISYSQARIVQMATGGGFGGKEDAPSAPGAMCALLAWKTKRPVKYIMTREEDMLCMSKRHPGKIRYRTAVSRDGHIRAVDVDYRLNGGAYATLSPVVLWRGIVHAGGPYRIPAARVHAYALRTNTVPCGAFRGFGEPQVTFACEAHVDYVAEQMNLDPLDFRMRNLLDYGDETITGHRLETSMGMREVMEKVVEASGWRHQRAASREAGHPGEVRSAPALSAIHPNGGPLRRGIGIAAVFYGVGLGAQGKHLNPAGANVVVAGDGSVTLAVGTTEIGQGMVTVLSQIAAESLGCPLDRVRVVEPDTSRVPDSGPTVASRTTLMSGNAVRDGCRQILDRMKAALARAGHDWELMTWKERVAQSLLLQVQLAAQGWAVPPTTTFDLETGQGDPYVTYTWSVNTVEVEVDTDTGEVRPIKVVSGHDVGKMINPQTGEGQIEGGVVQGLGYALVEEHASRDGRILNNQFSTYIIPTPMDAPEIVPIIVEHEYPWGPYGAKGLGETPIIGVAPAVVNAIAHATGVRLREIPATPERVWQAWREARGH